MRTRTTYTCSQCGHNVGCIPEPYLCHRTGQQAEPHHPIRRTTPKQPTPEPFTGPTLADVTR